MNVSDLGIQKAETSLARGRLRSRPDAACRRGADIIFATVCLLVGAPLMALIAIILWCESPGNVIFRQQRLGLHGKRFTLYKFRKFAASCGSEGPAVTVGADVRLTKIGAVLEKTKLDELPQLWNVLKGDLTLIGLRPEMPTFVDLFSGRYRELLKHPPGFFGPGYIRNESDLYPLDEDPEAYYRRVLFPQKAERFLAYQETANVFSDFLWILKGLFTTIAGAVGWGRATFGRVLVVGVDILIICAGWTIVSFHHYPVMPQPGSFVAGLWLFPGIFVICALAVGCYRYPPRYFAPRDAIRLVTVFSFAWAGAALLLMHLAPSTSIPVLSMGWLIVCLSLVVGHAAFTVPGRSKRTTPRRGMEGVLIYGVNVGGVALADWMMANPAGGILVGFLTDDREQIGQRVHGVPVLGSERDVIAISTARPVGEIWMTFAPSDSKRKRLRTLCRQQGLKLVALDQVEPFRRFVPSAAASNGSAGSGRRQNA